MSDDYNNLRQNYEFMEARLTQMQSDMLDLSTKLETALETIEKWDEKRKRKQKSEMNSRLVLEEAKQQFIEEIKDSINVKKEFTDYDLVFWASYALVGTDRQEKLTAWSEVVKRAKKIREMISFFKEKYCIEIKDAKQSDRYARALVKDFLWFFLTDYERFGPEKKPNTFWTATSDWALNNYSHNIELYHQIHNLPDESLD